MDEPILCVFCLMRWIGVGKISFFLAFLCLLLMAKTGLSVLLDPTISFFLIWFVDCLIEYLCKSKS